MDSFPQVAATLEQIPIRLRKLRTLRNLSLADLSKATGISKSTLSRLETGQRKPTLELLLPLATALAVPMDELIHAPQVIDPRIIQERQQAGQRTYIPLSRSQGEPKAYKLTIPASETEPHVRTHSGHEWLYVLSGKLRLILGKYDLVLKPGEVAEFDTQHPHWFGSTGSGPVEIISMFGKDGERIHIRAKPASATTQPKRDSGG